VVGHIPADLTRRRHSRTVDRFHIADETTVSFTHDRELPWLLPGLAATGREVRVLAITVVGFDRGRLASQRTLWDLVTMCRQLGVDANRVSATGR
jgi:carboxymethylenebutenolidase